MAMPGNTRRLVDDGDRECCFAIEDFCTKEPTMEVCTESDSFGDEWTATCMSCLQESKRREEASTETTHCSRCNLEFLLKDLKTRRDWEEGQHGPVYDMCPACAEIWDLSDSISFAEMDDENPTDPEVIRGMKGKLNQLRKKLDERKAAVQSKQ